MKRAWLIRLHLPRDCDWLSVARSSRVEMCDRSPGDICDSSDRSISRNAVRTSKYNKIASNVISQNEKMVAHSHSASWGESESPAASDCADWCRVSSYQISAQWDKNCSLCTKNMKVYGRMDGRARESFYRLNWWSPHIHNHIWMANQLIVMSSTDGRLDISATISRWKPR